jgi:ribosomal protein L32
LAKGQVASVHKHKNINNFMEEELLSMLLALDGVAQDPRWHPEGDALFHSLQVFQHAHRESDDPLLWAAALFHDVGKAQRDLPHDQAGAWLLDGLLCPRIVWLVAHHLDLMRRPSVTKRRYRRTSLLVQLQQLRRWDVAGRQRLAHVMTPEQAIEIVFDNADRHALGADGDIVPTSPTTTEDAYF